jgi:hypothetical protein
MSTTLGPRLAGTPLHLLSTRDTSGPEGPATVQAR